MTRDRTTAKEAPSSAIVRNGLWCAVCWDACMAGRTNVKTDECSTTTPFPRMLVPLWQWWGVLAHLLFFSFTGFDFDSRARRGARLARQITWKQKTIKNTRGRSHEQKTENQTDMKQRCGRDWKSVSASLFGVPVHRGAGSPWRLP